MPIEGNGFQVIDKVFYSLRFYGWREEGEVIAYGVEFLWGGEKFWKFTSDGSTIV